MRLLRIHTTLSGSRCYNPAIVNGKGILPYFRHRKNQLPRGVCAFLVSRHPHSVCQHKPPLTIRDRTRRSQYTITTMHQADGVFHGWVKTLRQRHHKLAGTIYQALVSCRQDGQSSRPGRGVECNLFSQNRLRRWCRCSSRLTRYWPLKRRTRPQHNPQHGTPHGHDVKYSIWFAHTSSFPALADT